VFCLIDGLPGVGKTALALRFAHSVAGEYPDGQLYASLRGFHPAGGPRRATTLLSRLLQDLGVAPSLIPAGPEARAAKFRSILAGRRVVMVLDDAASADQVRPLLPGNSACLVLVTSRHRLGGLVARDGAYRVTLGVLGPADAHELLAGAVGADRVSADPSAAATLARQCGYLPLALHILADKIGTHPCVPLADFARELDHEAARLDALTVAGDPAAGVRATIARSYQRLPPSAARLYRLLAFYRGPSISVGAAAAVAAAAPAQAGALLAQLTGAHLLEESAPHRYQFHDLLRLYAAERAIAEDPQAERDAALARLSGGAGPGPAGEPPRDQRRYGQGPRSAHCTAELGHAQPGHTQPGHAQQHGARAEGGHGRAARLPHPHATDGPARLASGTPHRKTPWTRSLGRRRRWPGPPARCRWR
jgi:hypothetical protein